MNDLGRCPTPRLALAAAQPTPATDLEGRVTLRARLTAAFLAVVLGPVLLGAVFVGAMVTAVDRSRAVDRLDHAAGAVRGTLDALCGELRAGALAAGALADRPAVRERPDVAV